MFESIGGRKFFGFLLVLGLATAVQILSPSGVNEAYAALLVGALATFATANAYVSAKMEAKTPEPISISFSAEPGTPSAPDLTASNELSGSDLTPQLKADVEQLQETVMTLAASVQATNNLLRVAGLKQASS